MTLQNRPPLPRHKAASPSETMAELDRSIPSGPVFPRSVLAPAPEASEATPSPDAPEPATAPEGALAPDADPEVPPAEGAEHGEGLAPAEDSANPAEQGGTDLNSPDLTDPDQSTPEPVDEAVDFPATADGAGARPADTPLPPPKIAPYRAPDLTRLRAPILRPPPPKAMARAPDILKSTGSTPSQHHANIQTALFRVTQTARTAQRDMVQSVESLAHSARWSIEELAGRIDGIVAACTASVSASARAAYAEVERVADQQVADIVAETGVGMTAMADRETTVRQQVMTSLLTNGSQKITDANAALIASYDASAADAARQIPPIAQGQQPVPLPNGTKQKSAKGDAAAPTGGQAASTTFAKEGELITGRLTQASAGNSYHTRFLNAPKIRIVPAAAVDMTNGWLRAAKERVKLLTSADNHNRFVMNALGLTVPTAEGMTKDDEYYQTHLSDAVYAAHGRMSGAKERAVMGILSTLSGPRSVKNFFDPENTHSMPFQVNKGLRENGAKMKQALMQQALETESGFRASIADMAAAYPDAVDRLARMLEGEDLLDERLFVPRVEQAGLSLLALHDGHVGQVKGNVDATLRQTRASFQQQTRGLWSAVDDATDTILEQKLKSSFHFILTKSFYTGSFGSDLQAALGTVTRYADEAARAMLAPVAAAGEAVTRVQRVAIDHFNGQLAGEWSGWLEAVKRFGPDLGEGEKPSDGKPFAQIEKAGLIDLDTRMGTIMSAVKPVETGRTVALGTLAVLAAPFSGGLSLVAGGAAVYSAIDSMPDKSRIATALAMPTDGPRALDEHFAIKGKAPNASERIQQYLPDDDYRKNLLNLFSEQKATAVSARRNLITDAKGLFNINDDAVAALAATFTPEDRELLGKGQIKAMADSVRSNLSGVQLQVTQAYLDGKPARAAALRILDDLNTARRRGDEGLAGFSAQMDSEIAKDLRLGQTGYVSPEEIRRRTEAVYLELGALIPPPGAQERSVVDRLPPSNDPAVNADAAHVANARARFANFATRDYAHLDPDGQGSIGGVPVSLIDQMVPGSGRSLSLLTSIPGLRDKVLDHGSDDYASQKLLGWFGSANAPVEDIGPGKRRMGGIALDRMGSETSTLLNLYITQGPGADPNHDPIREAQAVQALALADGRSFGTAESDVVRFNQLMGSPALSLAKARIADAEARHDPIALENAQQELLVAEQAHDRFIARVYARSHNLPVPENPGKAEIATAKLGLSSRLNSLTGNFNGDLKTAGNDIINNGAIDLTTGMRVATAGIGTYNALETEVMSNRTRDQMDRFFTSDQAKKDGNTREELGLGSHSNFFSENSGDEAFELFKQSRGVPTNAAERAELAQMTSRHQLAGGSTWISRLIMSGTPEDTYLRDSEAAVGQRVADSIRANNDPRNPVPPWVLALTPDQYFDEDGLLRDEVRRYAVDRHGEFFGSGPSIDLLSAQVDVGAKAYQDAIERQESFFTNVITAAATVASIALLFIPGVNLVAAGVMVAVLAGTATIAVKAGMRGGRYGWEEAATDVAKTAIEAATAGIGGAMGGAVRSEAAIMGHLAKLGNVLTKTFGRVGAAMIREGIMAAIGGVANKALDDKIWTNGVGQGLSTLFTAGVQGGIVGAVTGGLSEGVSMGSMKLLTPGIAGAETNALARLGARLGPASRNVVQEALSSVAGAISGESLRFLFDVTSGAEHASWEKFFTRIGPLALKDMLTAIGRAGASNHMKGLYHAELQRLRMSGEPISAGDAKMLRRLAISAGEEQYGRGHADSESHGEGHTGPRRSAIDGFTVDLVASRSILQTMPPHLSAQMAALSLGDLQHFQSMRATGAKGDPTALSELHHTLANSHPGVDVNALAQDMVALHAQDRQDAAAAAQADKVAQTQSRALRRAVLQDLPPAARQELADHPMDALLPLPPALRAEAARLIASGDPGGHGLAALMAKAGDAANPQALQDQLSALITARPTAEAAAAAKAQQRRAEVLALLPPDLQSSLHALPDKDVTFLHRALTGEASPTAQTLAHLTRMLAQRAPDLSPQAITAHLTNAATQHQTTRQAAHQAQVQADRSRRMDQMDHIPEADRAALSALPDDALLELRLAQHLGRPLPEASHQAMLTRALSLDPTADPIALSAAISRTLATRPAPRPFFERFRQRRALVGQVPKDMLPLVRQTPILTLPDAAFASLVRSHPDSVSGPQDNAATLRLNGEVVVITRQGTDAFALREEGLHVLQLHDPAWTGRLSGLDETRLGNWHLMGLNEQLALSHAVTDAEIDAHRAMTRVLQAEADRAILSRTKSRLAEDLTRAQTRLDALLIRKDSLNALTPQHRMAIEAGLTPRPHWLEQPPRLFNADAGKSLTEDEVLKFAAKRGLGPEELPAPATSTKTAKPAPLPDPVAMPSDKTWQKWAAHYTDTIGATGARKDRSKAIKGFFKTAQTLPPELQNALLHVLNRAHPLNAADGTSQLRGRLLMEALTNARFLAALDVKPTGTPGHSEAHQRLIALVIHRMGDEFHRSGHGYNDRATLANQVETYKEMILSIRKIQPDALVEPALQAVGRKLMVETQRRKHGDDSALRNVVERRALADFLEKAPHIRAGTNTEYDMAALAHKHLGLAIPDYIASQFLKKAMANGMTEVTGDPKGVYRDPKGVACIINKHNEIRPVNDMVSTGANKRPNEEASHHNFLVGRFGEVMADQHVTDKAGLGWTRIHPKGSGPRTMKDPIQGSLQIDAVYSRVVNGKTVYMVVDVKTNGAKLGWTKAEGNQMSAKWILNRLANSDLTPAQIKAIQNQMDTHRPTAFVLEVDRMGTVSAPIHVTPAGTLDRSTPFDPSK